MWMTMEGICTLWINERIMTLTRLIIIMDMMMNSTIMA